MELPYRSISVKLVCERAGLARKTFYRRFNGKSDVLFLIFDTEIVQPELELCRLLTFGKMNSHAPLMERHMFGAVAQDGAFYRALVSTSEGADAFFQVARRAFADFNAEMLREAGFDGTPGRADLVADYFAGAKALFMQKWVSEGFAVSADDVADLYSRMALPFWRELV